MSALCCLTCRRVVAAANAAARVWMGKEALTWCLKCWDSPSEVAVNQYRNASNAVVAWRSVAEHRAFGEWLAAGCPAVPEAAS